MPRKLFWLTDVHWNFIHLGQLLDFCEAIKAKNPDGLVITGDIAEAHNLRELLTVVTHEIPGTPIYYVLGNHDYYKGSIKAVRDALKPLQVLNPNLIYMPTAGVVELSKDTCLIGVDGWSDGRMGLAETSKIGMADWELIADLKPFQRMRTLLIQKLREIADDEALQARKLLEQALPLYKRVIFMTHIPPWREATWHEGEHSDNHWLPWFSCKAVGDVIVEMADQYPDRKVEVFCGHTHSKGVSQITDNVTAITGAAEYGKPRVNGIIEIEGDTCLTSS